MKVKWGLLALLSTAILAAPSNSAYVDALTSEQASTSRSTLEYLAKRHGHGEHADEVSMSDVKPEVHDVSHHIPDRLDSTSSSSLASTVAATIASPSPSALKPHHNEINKATNGHANSHTHHHLHQAHIPVPLLQDKNTFIPIPPPPSGGGGHSHGGHGAESPKVELNETVIVQWRGPDPLSYLEWDFNYSIGKTEDLIRFSQAYKSSPRVRLMGVGDNRWRTLLDERDPSLRLSIASDILQRAQNDRRDPGRRRNLLLLHVVGCILSCFVLLPVALALRAAESSLAPLASTLYLLTFATSLFISALYKAKTPQLYPTNSHSGLGYAVFWMSLIALSGDVYALLRSVTRNMSRRVTLNSFLSAITMSRDRRDRQRSSFYDASEEDEMLPSSHQGDSDNRDDRSHHQAGRQSSSESSSQQSHRVHFAQDLPRNEAERGWSHAGSSRQGSGDSGSPTSTLCNNTPRASLFGDSFQDMPTKSSKFGNDDRVSRWRQFDEDTITQHSAKGGSSKTRQNKIFRVLKILHVVVARSIPIISFAAAYTGLAVYTGSCRGAYSNACMAHGIKGGIFFWYGLLSFSRYLGAYADLGWAWNRQPTAGKSHKQSTAVSAEWVECFVIFFYGATNTWMERFGAKKGDPYTVKQVQHISIAIMFWFAGLMGLILETKSFRNLLALPVALKQHSVNTLASSSSHHDNNLTCEEAVALPAKPPSYNFSFNPFPALVIGVTGVAMAAHHQDYLYEVSIHSLWGNLLAGFSFFRIMTYFFLWLRPPTSSILPSRPPTEALASFSLTCGGLVFMLSSEEVSFAAMRNGFGDMMMILNVTVAIVSLLFCGIAALLIMKAVAVRYEKRKNDEAIAIRLEEMQNDQQNRPPCDNDANTPVFILEDEAERRSQQAEDGKRQMSSSPLSLALS